MAEYTPEQLQILKDAVHAGREAMRRAERYEAPVFAAAFVAHNGVQVPGASTDAAVLQILAHHVLRSLRGGRLTSRDRTVMREVRRAQAEAQWTRLAQSEQVVGFYLKLGPASQLHTPCLEWLAIDHGLGAAVFPKGRVVVLPPDCEDYEFVPVHEHELEQ